MEVALSSASNRSESEQPTHKNRLQEYAQRLALPLPLYQTVSEGPPHDPQFRASVIVDGVIFTSSRTFLRRKESEQYVAKMALEVIYSKIKQEGHFLIREDATFCKSILYEYSVEMNLNMPIYTCSELHGLVPIFISSVLVDGKTFEGFAGRNKKQAEQLAARAAIESVLGNSNSSARTVMSRIIKSKAKLFCYSHQGVMPNHSPEMNASSGGNIQNLATNRVLPGTEIQGALTNELPPIASHNAGCVHEERAGQELQAGACMPLPSSGHVGRGTMCVYQSNAYPPTSWQVIIPSQAVSESCCGQVLNAKLLDLDPSGNGNGSQVTPLGRKRKRKRRIVETEHAEGNSGVGKSKKD